VKGIVQLSHLTAIFAENWPVEVVKLCSVYDRKQLGFG
jgi:hypothetical protein